MGIKLIKLIFFLQFLQFDLVKIRSEILRLFEGFNLNTKVDTKLPIDKKSNERSTTSAKLT